MHRVFDLFKLMYTVYTALVFIALLLIAFPFVMILSLWKDKALLPMLWMCRFIAIGLMVFCGVIYRFHRNKNIVYDHPYMLIANHRSNLDAPVAAISCRGRVRYLAKKELLKVPVMGQIFRVMSVYVDRSSPADRRASVEKLKKFVQNGDSIFIFPEGTRNKTMDRTLIDFKDGAFTIAIQTQTPILPMLYLHTDALLPNNKPLMRPGVIDIHYLDPVEVTGLGDADVPFLREKVRTIMEQRYLELMKQEIK